MPNIVQFIPKQYIDAAENVRSFVELCRIQLTVFGELDWSSVRWEITSTLRRKGRSVATAIIWTNLDTTRKAPGEPLRQPFADFAKAFTRYRFGLRPTLDVTSTFPMALRALERALCERSGEPRVEHSGPEVFNRAAMLTRERWGPKSAYAVGTRLEEIAQFVVEHRLVRAGFQWRSPIPRVAAPLSRIGKEADDRREHALPTQCALDSLAQAFVVATTPRDRLTSSVGGILVSAPDRLNEVLRLAVDCRVYDVDDDRRLIGLRWRPSKAAAPFVKPIIKTVAEVAAEAVSKALAVTEDARRMASWYEQYPDKLYLPPEYEHLRSKKYLTPAEVQELCGISEGSGTNFLRRLGVPYSVQGAYKPALVRFDDFELAMVAQLPQGFPVLDPESSLRYSDAIFIIPTQFFTSPSPSKVMFMSLTWDHLNRELGGGYAHGAHSVFSRLGLTEPDGSPIRIRSHQFRHWLNTLGQKGGASQHDLAKWSGRKDVGQNQAYDHMSGSEVVEMVRGLDDDKFMGPLAEFVSRPPISRDEFLALKIPTAHFTEFGICVHDWTMLPCARHRDCIHCHEQFCIKGDIQKTERIRRALADTEDELRKADAAEAERYTGANRWVVHHRETVARLKELLAIMEDPSVPDGSVIQLSGAGRYSAIGVALESGLGLPAEQRRQLLGSIIMANAAIPSRLHPGSGSESEVI